MSAAVSVTPVYSQGLDADAKKTIASFGEGVIVLTSTDVTIGKAIDYAGLKAGSTTFKIVSGKDAGKSVDRTVKPKSGASDTYIVSMGKTFTSTLVVENGGIFLTTEVNTDSSTISTFDPSEPVLLDQKKLKRTIKVVMHDIDKPTVVKHSGSLACTFEVLGTFKVKAPAGTFDAIGVRQDYHGSMGPANVTDTNYIFFAKDVGPVAMRFSSHIEAFLVYNKDMKTSLLLSKK